MFVCLSLRPSVRPHGINRLPLDGVPWNFIFHYFSKICTKKLEFYEILCFIIFRKFVWKNSSFMKFYISLFFENLYEKIRVSWNFIFHYFSKICMKKFEFHYNLTWTKGTLHEYLRTFMLIPRSIHLRTKNFSNKFVRNIKTHSILLPTLYTYLIKNYHNSHLKPHTLKMSVMHN